MKPSRIITIVGIAVVAALVAIFLWGPSSVPAGQQPMLSLSHANFGEFTRAFDAGSDSPRLVLLLSPT